jgi:hypothetical protein
VHANFSIECACISGLTRFAGHSSLRSPEDNDVIELGCLRVGEFSIGGNCSSER